MVVPIIMAAAFASIIGVHGEITENDDNYLVEQAIERKAERIERKRDVNVWIFNSTDTTDRVAKKKSRKQRKLERKQAKLAARQ